MEFTAIYRPLTTQGPGKLWPSATAKQLKDGIFNRKGVAGADLQCFNLFLQNHREREREREVYYTVMELSNTQMLNNVEKL